MSLQTFTAFPLKNITKHELKQLCRALWGWSLCSDCEDSSTSHQHHRQQCRTPECCSSNRQQYERLSLFFDFYKQLTSPYVPDFFDPEDQALRSHQDLFDIISLLREHGDHLTRDECRVTYFSQRCDDDSKGEEYHNDCTIPLADQERAFNLATTIMTMVRISSPNDFSAPNFDIDMATSDPEQGLTTSLQEITSPLIWRPEQTLQEAILDAFPSRIHPSLQPGDPQSKTILAELTAVNLTRIAKLKFVGTNDLRNHLKLDCVTGTVQIFHHTSFLKEHLLSSKRDIEARYQELHTKSFKPIPGSSAQPLQDPNQASNHTTTPEVEEENNQKDIRRGFILPRQLALETLQTLNILFPPPSHPQFTQNQSLLRSLVSKSHFDPDILRFGTTAYQLPSESSNFQLSPSFSFPNTSPRQERGDDNNKTMYPIFGNRLMALHAELEDPTPRGVLDIWLEKRSKSRHVMFVTLAGVTVAIILGVLSLAVSVFQAWISWMEWKHPT